MVNIDLLEATMARVERNPHQHDQGSWFTTVDECGTTFCFAGHAAIEAGAQPPTAEQIRANGGWWVNPDDPVKPHLTVDMNTLMEVQDWSAAQLELTNGQRSALFLDAGTAYHLRVMVDAIKADPDITQKGLLSLVGYESDEEEVED